MTENSARPSPIAPKLRRAAKGKRWSASSTLEWLDADRKTIARGLDMPAGAVKVRVHYRLDGTPKRPTYPVSTAAELDEVRSFRAELELAYQHNWPADAAGKPISPTPLPNLAKVSDVGTDPQPTVDLSGLLRDGAGPLDAERLVKIFAQHQRTSKKKRGGGKKSRTTQGGYDSHHKFFLDHARYRPGDPRLAVLGLPAGASWVFDNANAPIVAADLLQLIAIRSATNLRDRGVNERLLAEWHRELHAAAAAAGSGPINTTPMPELRPEEPKGRTVEAFAQQLGAMLTHAYNYGYLAQNLWTEPIKAEVPHAAATSYTTRTVPARKQIAQLVNSMRLHSRLFRGPDGVTCEVTGDRYAAAVWIAGRMAPRPEELIAIRDSWVVLDPNDPRIVLHHAEVIIPAHDGVARVRAQVPLKHREPGEVRVLRPDKRDRKEFIEVLSRHRRDHVDPDGDPDQHFFTTHSGKPMDPSNWNDDWWKPVRDTVFAGDAYLADLPFRRLRAAAITDWLIELGWSTYKASQMAGNSQAVLEGHYKGVLAERPADADDDSGSHVAPSSVPPVEPADMDAVQIAARKKELEAVVAAARDEFKALQSHESAQLDLTL